MTVVQGWYDDPWDAAHFRWWDGIAWTQHLQPKQAPAPAPLPVQIAPTPHPTPEPVPTTVAGLFAQQAPAAQTPLAQAPLATLAPPVATYAAVAPAASEVRAPASTSPVATATMAPASASTAEPGTRADLRSRIPAQALLDRLAESHGLGHLAPDTSPRDLKIDIPARMYHLGVTGQRQVGELLAGLPSGWLVLHSVPTGASTGNIDHVVIGPGGVFTINVRHHPGATVAMHDMVLTVNGQAQHCLPSTVNDARRADSELSKAVGFSVPVTGVLVFVGAKRFNDSSRAGVAGAQLWRDDDLIRNLTETPRRLDPAQLSAVAAAAVRPETWHVRPRLQTDVGPLTRDFELFDEAVALADRRGKLGTRLVVVGASLLAVAGGAWLAWQFAVPLLA